MNIFVILLAILGGITLMVGLLTFILKLIPIFKALFKTLSYTAQKEIELHKELTDKKIEIKKQMKLKKLEASVSESIKDKIIKDVVEPTASMMDIIKENNSQEK